MKKERGVYIHPSTPPLQEPKQKNRQHSNSARKNRKVIISYDRKI